MLEDLIRIARAAGQKLRELQPAAAQQRWSKGDRGDLVTTGDIVTVGDLTSQEVMVKMLRETALRYPFIAEEQENPEALPPEHINADPCDGTAIYSAGCPEYGIAMAYVRDSEPQCGVLYQPARDVLIAAERGSGCRRFCGSERTTVRFTHALPLGQSVVGADLGPVNHRDKVKRVLLPLAGNVQYIRVIGSAVGALISLLEGQTAAYVCPGAKIWDLCAGALAVREAGGVALAPDGAPLSWNRLSMSGLFAANEQLAHDLVFLTKGWTAFEQRRAH